MMIVVLLLFGLALGVAIERVIGPPSERVRAADGSGVDGRARVGLRKRRSKKKILARVALVLVLFLIAGSVGAYLWASSVFDKIEKVDVSAELRSGGAGTNYLLVGVDNATDAAEAGREGVEGTRSDTIMILNINGSTARMMSLNRDLWVTKPDGSSGRINATYRDGPANLIRTIWDNYQIPIDHYVEIDFVSFGGLVDSFGGVDINFPHPAKDLASGLYVPEAGLVHLDGDQALAYVRSRHYIETIDGVEREDPLSDISRVQRQQTFLRAIMGKVGEKRNPLTLMKAASKMSDGLRIDDDMSMLEAARFAWSMGKLNPETVVLPTVNEYRGQAAVLVPGEGAEAVLATFR